MIQPIKDHILIAIVNPEKETKTQAGIILTGNAIEHRQSTATVLRVGEGRMREDGTFISCVVKPGDEIIYYDYAGVQVYPKNSEPDKSYFLIKQNDILAIITD